MIGSSRNPESVGKSMVSRMPSFLAVVIARGNSKKIARLIGEAEVARRARQRRLRDAGVRIGHNPSGR